MSSMQRSFVPSPSRERLVRFWVTPALERQAKHLMRLKEGDIRRNRETIVLKENRLRAVYRAKLPFLDFPVLIKVFRHPTVRRILRGIVTPYADRELSNALKAIRIGIPVADPLFLVRKRRGWRPGISLLAYRFLEGSSLYQYLSVQETLPYRERLWLMRSAGEFTALLHDKGGKHGDYHAGNLMILRDGTLALTDLFPLSFTKSLSEKDRVEGLAHLVASLLPTVGKAGIDELLDGYRAVSRVPLSMEAEDRIMAQQRALRRRHEISRARRCLKNSSQFYQVRLPGLRVAARRDLPLEEIRFILQEFRKVYRYRPESALKNAPESVILTLDIEEGWPLCVKWYRKRGGWDNLKEWIRGGRALRAWKAGNALLARGIPVATPYAMVRTAEEGILVMERAEGIELDRLLFRLLQVRGDTVRRLKNCLSDTLGHLMGTLHGRGIYHADMKACNLLVAMEGETPRVKLVDYDRVQFFDTLPERFMIRNLVQLNLSIPREVSRSLRFRFLRAYVGNHPHAPGEKRLFRRVWEESRKASIVYVTDRGDREEHWQS